MTKIVGIDFGTANIRIAQWDSASGEAASNCPIGSETLEEWMPAVISFHRLPSGDVDYRLGESADLLDDGPDVCVVRNIKRWALASDKQVRNSIEFSFQQSPEESCPTWLNLEKRLVTLWNETVSVEEVIARMLKEAISRAGLAGEAAEWRAGCPVSSDLSYRRALVSALTDLGCTGKIEWITEEPLLLLAFGDAMSSLRDGSYLVYDMGGGSFDCAIVAKSGEGLTVYAEGGLPSLGGMDIDEMLKTQIECREGFEYSGPTRDLRIAKEELSAGRRTEIVLDSGHTLTKKDVDTVLDKGKFIQKTLMAALDAYKKAKLMWNRPDGSPPYGEYLSSGSGTTGTVWALGYEDLACDVDRVLLVGGPTRMPYFTEKLKEVFGDEKVITAEDLIPLDLSTDTGDLALTALSRGACYMYGRQYMPITVDRVPADITLSITNGSILDRFEAFQSLQDQLRSHPASHYEGKWINLDNGVDQTYSVTISSPDGHILYEFGPERLSMPREGYKGPVANRIKIAVDRLGSVWVKLGVGYIDLQPPQEDFVPVVEHPVWQTETQKEIIKRRHEDQQRYKELETARTRRIITRNPFAYDRGW